MECQGTVDTASRDLADTVDPASQEELGQAHMVINGQEDHGMADLVNKAGHGKEDMASQEDGCKTSMARWADLYKASIDSEIKR